MEESKIIDEENFCDMCGKDYTEEFLTIASEFEDNSCDCMAISTIEELRNKIQIAKKKIEELIDEKTDGNFSELNRDDLVDLRYILEK